MGGEGYSTHQDWSALRKAEKKVLKVGNEPTIYFRINKPLLEAAKGWGAPPPTKDFRFCSSREAGKGW